MPITTLDQAIAGMQPLRYYTKTISPTLVIGRPHTWWALAGSPGAGDYNTTLNGAVLTGPVVGQMPRNNPLPGNHAYLARFSVMPGPPGMLMLCDRLWQCRPANVAGAQAIVSPPWPARDIAGTANGDGILLAVEYSTAQTAGTPTCAVSYTNQAGVSGRTANLIDAITATTALGSFLRMDLQAGDTGVRSVQSVNFSAPSTGGVWNLVAYRVIATLEFNWNTPVFTDMLTSGMPRIYDNSVPFLVFVSGAASGSVTSGTYIETHG